MAGNSFQVQSFGSASVTGVALGDSSQSIVTLGGASSQSKAAEEKVAELTSLLEQQDAISPFTRADLIKQVQEATSTANVDPADPARKDAAKRRLAGVLNAVKETASDAVAIVSCLHSLASILGIGSL